MEETHLRANDYSTDEKKSSEEVFPVVGIGASDGGFEALKSFLSHFPHERGITVTFIFIHHGLTEYDDLENLLQPLTRLKIVEATEEMPVEPNSLYLIPPHKRVELREGRLHLHRSSTTKTSPLPIDSLFRSLAWDQGERSIGIVLSGCSNDGTLGLKEIKGKGGLTIVQDPDSTKYKNMPASAIANNLGDFILPPEKIPEQLIGFIKSSSSRERGSVVHILTSTPQGSFQEIINLLREETGHNFSGYKKSTIGRRIERRLAINQIEHLHEYLTLMRQNKNEVKALFQELLVGVTNFFRDAEAFDVLQEKVFPRLFFNKSPSNSIRVWVPGCSTGEEAYTLAILLQEYRLRLKQPFKIQVFATDIDTHSIQTARTGVFPVSIATDISHERIKNFFTLGSEGNTYSIQKAIRDMLIFAEQNIIEDPPFSRIDLISCRNLLIFMDLELQKRVLQLFSYALNPHGYLFLGTSETTGDLIEHFHTIHRRWKIYQSKGIPLYRPTMKNYFPLLESPNPGTGGHKQKSKISLRDIVERLLLQEYTPACSIITKRGEILYIHGRTGKYLEPAPGEMSLNIIQMAREGLKKELSTAIRRACLQREPVYYPRLKIKGNGETTTIDLTVKPLETTNEYKDLLLVVFEDIYIEEEKERWREEVAVTSNNPSEDRRISSLEQELADKEEHLQTVIEELETSNEELQSTNEELQSTNEELETSKEELQSVNEELITVNTELQKKIEELSITNNDMNNMLAGTGVGTVFVDLLQRIQRFTPPISKVINLIPSDLGRPVKHLSLNLIGYHSLSEDVQEVLDTLVTKEVEVQTTKKEWYLMRILPYRTAENAIEGAVITFINITMQRQMQSASQLALFIQDSNDAIIVQNLKGEILAWNPKAEKLYGYSKEEALGMNISTMVPEDKCQESLDLMKRVATQKIGRPFKTQRITKDGDMVNVWIMASVLCNQSGDPYGLFSTEKEIL